MRPCSLTVQRQRNTLCASARSFRLSRSTCGASIKKIITTVALRMAAILAAHGAIGDNPFQLAARFQTKPIIIEQMTSRTIRVVYAEDGWISVVNLLDGISKAELMARADNGFVGYEDIKAQVTRYGGEIGKWKADKTREEGMFAWGRPEGGGVVLVGRTTPPPGKETN